MGCIGDRSVATISVWGNSSPIMIAQSPVPVAMSRILLGGLFLERGARYRRSPKSFTRAAFWRSSLSCSRKSLGKA